MNRQNHKSHKNKGLISAIILAAGLASRAAGPKVTWPVKGVPSVRRAALAALSAESIGEVVAVTGAWSFEVKAALTGLPIKIAHNPDYAHGQAQSVKAGLAATHPKSRAAVFILADQPFITPEIIDGLVEFYETHPVTIAVPVFQNQRRNPVLFDLNRWKETLSSQNGDQGGRGIIEKNLSEAGLWPAPGPAASYMDFDTALEYEALGE